MFVEVCEVILKQALYVILIKESIMDGRAKWHCAMEQLISNQKLQIINICVLLLWDGCRSNLLTKYSDWQQIDTMPETDMVLRHVF